MLRARPDRATSVFVGALLMALALMGLILGAPWLVSHGYPVAGVIIYQIFAPLCHQMPERSFHLDGATLAVCARCTGVYAGLVIGLLVYPLWRRIDNERMPDRLWLVPALAPIAVDALGGVLGAFSSPMVVRAATGLLAGAAIASFILPGLVSIAGSSATGMPRHSKALTR